MKIYTHLLAFANKIPQQKALNYIPTSWSRAKVLFLVTFLNLALMIIYGDIVINVHSLLTVGTAEINMEDWKTHTIYFGGEEGGGRREEGKRRRRESRRRGRRRRKRDERRERKKRGDGEGGGKGKGRGREG